LKLPRIGVTIPSPQLPSHNTVGDFPLTRPATIGMAKRPRIVSVVEKTAKTPSLMKLTTETTVTDVMLEWYGIGRPAMSIYVAAALEDHVKFPLNASWEDFRAKMTVAVKLGFMLKEHHVTSLSSEAAVVFLNGYEDSRRAEGYGTIGEVAKSITLNLKKDSFKVIVANFKP
jgi:hypothetical protein